MPGFTDIPCMDMVRERAALSENVFALDGMK
jgi:hypothetical protein